jgi:hypothetical protein
MNERKAVHELRAGGEAEHEPAAVSLRRVGACHQIDQREIGTMGPALRPQTLEGRVPLLPEDRDEQIPAAGSDQRRKHLQVLQRLASVSVDTDHQRSR